LFQIVIAFTQTQHDYKRFIDSADIALSEDAQKALLFLDSIPTPLNEQIRGSIGQYYFLQGIAYDRTRQDSKLFQSYILSVRYAEEEKDFDTAADASLELFSNMFFLKKDTSAYTYLEKAKNFYTLSNNTIGLLEVELMHAYVAFTEKRYEKSNQLILENLDLYRNIKDDAYYYLLANYMLSSNYIHLNDLTNAHTYLKQFHNLKSNSTIDSYNYNTYAVSLTICMSKLHLDKKQIDSTLYYLSVASKSRNFMDVPSTRKYFSFSTEAYKQVRDYDKSKTYLDSLQQLQEEVLDNTVSASLELNTVLLNSEETLRDEIQKKRESQNWILVLVLVLVILIALFIFRYQKFKSRLKNFSLKKENFFQLETKHEKLKVRRQELEHYITDIRDKVRQIASIEDYDAQKNKIRDLSRTINAEASNLTNSEENHITILKQLNLSFFEKIKKDHPSLTDTEFLICYYLKLEFKNKDIAFFLNRSLRSIESQRYRISKKMNLENSKVLIDYLNTHY